MTDTTAHEIRDSLAQDDRVTLVESDLNPDDPRMGSAQFLVSTVENQTLLESILPADATVSDSPPQPDAFVVGLPPGFDCDQ